MRPGRTLFDKGGRVGGMIRRGTDGDGRKAAAQNNAAPTAFSTRRLTDFAQVEQLYKSRLKKDFARNELRPLASLRRSWEKDAYDCYGLFAGEELLGYAFFVRQGKNYLFDYLGIAEDYRDQGLGSIFLRQLAAGLTEADCVIGEVEDPEKAKDEQTRAVRQRRLQFYLRSGYLKTELRSVVFGVDYRILEIPTGTTHTADELRTIYTGLYRSILPAPFFRTQFQVC